ncbi:MAG: hypothetical protein ABI648_04770 [Betaproteobacteria bacterium]|jgi:hypothetical protein
MNPKPTPKAYIIGAVLAVAFASILVGVVSMKAANAEGGDPTVKILLPAFLWIGVLFLIRGFWKGYKKLKENLDTWAER